MRPALVSEREGWISRLLKGAPPIAVRAAISQLGKAAAARQHTAAREAVLRLGMFDASFYLRTNQDVADAGTDPLDHYIEFGRAEGRAANPYLVERWYRKRTRIRRTVDALKHYAEKGEPRGHPPGPNFDPKWYREVYHLETAFRRWRTSWRTGRPNASPLVPALWSVANAPRDQAASAGTDPFLPYLAADGDSVGAAADIAVLAASGLIDANHYLVATT